MSYKVPTGGHFLITSGMMLNKPLIDEDLTFPAIYNAMMVGPISIALNVTLTVPANATMVVV